jgi:hypothetical protein
VGYNELRLHRVISVGILGQLPRPFMISSMYRNLLLKVVVSGEQRPIAELCAGKKKASVLWVEGSDTVVSIVRLNYTSLCGIIEMCN